MTTVIKCPEGNSFYRVANHENEQGLWYRPDGEFTGLIHSDLNFCTNSGLKMDFDQELVGWVSAVMTIEDLYQWFTKEDIVRLQKEGWFIYEYVAYKYKWYKRFEHWVIDQETSKITAKLELTKID